MRIFLMPLKCEWFMCDKFVLRKMILILKEKREIPIFGILFHYTLSDQLYFCSHSQDLTKAFYF